MLRGAYTSSKIVQHRCFRELTIVAKQHEPMEGVLSRQVAKQHEPKEGACRRQVAKQPSSMFVLLRRGAWGLTLERYLRHVQGVSMEVRLLENTLQQCRRQPKSKRRQNLQEGCMGATPFGGGTSLCGRGAAKHSKMMQESHFVEEERTISWWRSQPLRNAQDFTYIVSLGGDMEAMCLAHLTTCFPHANTLFKWCWTCHIRFRAYMVITRRFGVIWVPLYWMEVSRLPLNQMTLTWGCQSNKYYWKVTISGSPKLVESSYIVFISNLVGPYHFD